LSREEVEWIAEVTRRAKRAGKAWTSTEKAIGTFDVRLKRKAGSVGLNALQGFKRDTEAW
jgi:hypothetical protein